MIYVPVLYVLAKISRVAYLMAMTDLHPQGATLFSGTLCENLDPFSMSPNFSAVVADA